MMACQKMPKEYFCQTLQGGFHWISSMPSARTTQSRSRRHCSNWHCVWLSLHSSDKATPTPFSLGTAVSICAAAAERRCARRWWPLPAAGAWRKDPNNCHKMLNLCNNMAIEIWRVKPFQKLDRLFDVFFLQSKQPWRLGALGARSWGVNWHWYWRPLTPSSILNTPNAPHWQSP